MEFITSLMSFASLASWAAHPFMSIMLVIDGLVYNLVSYSFNLFMLMCQLDFSSLYGIVSPIVDRLQAVVLVLVVFKIAMSFIKWMIDPESAPKEGSKIVVNIFITAMFLIGYNFVFDVFNEVGMLIMGAPEGRDFVVLKQIANISGGDEGLIMRFIFGNNKEVEDIGDYMAYETVKIFIHDIEDPDNSPIVRSTICDDEKCDFNDLNELTVNLDKNVEYMWGISSIVGVYLIYSIVKMAIEIGVRMFKLLILQILAPIAIITILDGGIKSNTFQTFYKKYLSVYAEAFTRMLAMLITVVFVCKFYINIDNFFSPIGDTGAGGVTKFLLTIIVVVAAFRIADGLPKFIDEVLGTKMAKGDNVGVGKIAAGLVGSALGFAGGIGAGTISGAGVGGTLLNAASGAFKGYGAGSKGNNVADFFKNTGENNKASRERALNIARMGGGGQYALHGIENRLGITQRNQARAQRESDTAKALENMVAARSNALKNEKYNYNGQEVKFGDSADSFASTMLEYDNTVTTAKAAYESLQGEFDVNSVTDSKGHAYTKETGESDAAFRARIRNDKYKEYIKARDDAMSHYKKEYNNALFTNANVNKDANVIETTSVYDNRAANGLKSKDLSTAKDKLDADGKVMRDSSGEAIKEELDVSANLSDARSTYASSQSDINNRNSMQREQRPGRYQ